LARFTAQTAASNGADTLAEPEALTDWRNSRQERDQSAKK
jgi:hypothetical protein